MPSNHTPTLKSKTAGLKLVKPELATLQLGGVKPPEAMKPGDYLARCDRAWTEAFGKHWRAVWQFRIHEGPYHGVSLRKWLIIADASGHVSPFGDYAKACEIGLGRELTGDDDIQNPALIFSDKVFRVTVGYRKTERPNGGQASDENALIRKDAQDSLRVHTIVALVEGPR